MVVTYAKAVTQLKDRLVREFGKRIESIVLYCSVAKKRVREDSDIDILVVTRNDDRRLYDKISKVRTKIDLANNTLTALIHVSSEEFERYVKLGSPFIKSVAEEGLILYNKGIFKKARGSLAVKG